MARSASREHRSRRPRRRDHQAPIDPQTIPQRRRTHRGPTLAVSILFVPTLVLGALTDATWAPYVAGAAVVAGLFLIGAFALLHRPVASPQQPKRILVVAAHPDDLELACGASLARFVDLGHHVEALVMSRGARGGSEVIRAGEAVAAASFLELSDITVRDFTDTRMATEIGEMIAATEAMIGLVQPDVILTHSKHDQHQDHHAVHLAVLRAARRCSTILCFESPSVTSEFTPRFFVDVGDYMDVKAAAVRAHANQADKPYIDDHKLAGKALHRGEQARIDHAEGYEVVRALSHQLGSL
ncbi:LmbE family N-acetylglucosaminyl deacetylase [Pseudoclavibacter chungangensis]|uniref:PIG-L deacetylase family protein n=1 Tax=Pseudoclavibacter chungangensis TaxID=587635 RepID=UPI001814743E|nr:PIG-L deacetylase family protein [Pseudoclavibacter chungangensis]NYJ67806.1 LmbE family N-acetylglucosaminyl deacetylase [Pseudoclavibacter chungangensis]